MKIFSTPGSLSRMCLIDSSDCGFDLLNIEGTMESNFQVSSACCGPICIGEQLTYAFDSRIAGNDLSHTANARAIRPLTYMVAPPFPYLTKPRPPLAESQ